MTLQDKIAKVKVLSEELKELDCQKQVLEAFSKRSSETRVVSLIAVIPLQDKDGSKYRGPYEIIMSEDEMAKIAALKLYEVQKAIIEKTTEIEKLFA